MPLKPVIQDQAVASDALGSSGVEFFCPNCKAVTQDDVLFLCNKCGRDELIIKNGIYLCPACLHPGENFQCLKCDSKEVKLKFKKQKKSDVADLELDED